MLELFNITKVPTAIKKGPFSWMFQSGLKKYKF